MLELVWFIYVMSAEEGILRDTDRTEQAIVNMDSPGIVSNTSSIARRAHRILQVAQSEADNSEDPQFVDRVNGAVDRLRNSTFRAFCTLVVQCCFWTLDENCEDKNDATTVEFSCSMLLM